MKKNFVAVRSAYYKHQKITKQVKYNNKIIEKSTDGTTKSVVKTEIRDRSYKSALAEFEHVLRTGKTNSVNVFSQFSDQNVTVSPKHSESPLDAYYKCLDRYKKTTGKKCRSDMNTLFEHIVVLSSDHILNLEKKLGNERAKQEIVKCLKNYANTYAEKYGFTNLGFSLHYADEGHFDDNNKFVRNVHAHVMFFNYDFKNKKSNLRKLFKKGIDPATGKTHELNENFCDMQTIAAKSFKRLKFRRGVSKLITMDKYLPKNKYLLKQLKMKREQYKNLVEDIDDKKSQFLNYFKKWLTAIFNKGKADIYANLTAEMIMDINDTEIKQSITQAISNTENEFKRSNGETLADENSIIGIMKKNNKKGVIK
jgi:hypothetical protein